MSGAAIARLLPDGRRLHLQHGPIDIVAEAFGHPDEIRLAYGQAAARFARILDELVAELALLRRPVGDGVPAVESPVARRMVDAVLPHGEVFITPMAAVAGAVADEVLAAMTRGRTLAKAYVNNGGDIALQLAPGEQLRAGIVGSQDTPAVDGAVLIDHALAVRGIATSGWRGRSFSLGIADAVSAFARTAAAADAAATLIANAVDCGHPAIARRPANLLRDDTDLGDLLITVGVGALPEHAIGLALARGAARAEALRRAGAIEGAVLLLQSRMRVAGPLRPEVSVRAAE